MDPRAAVRLGSTKEHVLATRPPRRLISPPILAALALLVVWLAGCATGMTAPQTLTIATFFPTSGVDAALGKAMQDAVDLAVKQHGAIGAGYALTAEHVDANGSDPAAAV